MTSAPDEITQLLIAWNQGDRRARDELAQIIYDELRRLARRIVELRYFSELTIEEIAEVIGVSPATVKRDWSLARAWLRRELSR